MAFEKDVGTHGPARRSSSKGIEKSLGMVQGTPSAPSTWA